MVDDGELAVGGVPIAAISTRKRKANTLSKANGSSQKTSGGSSQKTSTQNMIFSVRDTKYEPYTKYH